VRRFWLKYKKGLGILIFTPLIFLIGFVGTSENEIYERARSIICHCTKLSPLVSNQVFHEDSGGN